MTPELSKQIPKSFKIFGGNIINFPEGEFNFTEETKGKYRYNFKNSVCKVSCEFRDKYFYYSISSNPAWYSGCAEYILGADGKIPIEEIDEENIFFEGTHSFDGKIKIKIKRNESIGNCNSCPIYRTSNCPIIQVIPKYYYMTIHFSKRDYQIYSEYGQEFNKKAKEYEDLVRSIGISDEEVKVKIEKALEKNMLKIENSYEILPRIPYNKIKCPICGKSHEVKSELKSESKSKSKFESLKGFMSFRCGNNGIYKFAFFIEKNGEKTLIHNFDNKVEYSIEKVLSLEPVETTNLELVEVTSERRKFFLKMSERMLGGFTLPHDGEYEKWQKNYWSTKVYEDIIKRYQRQQQIKQDS